VENILKKAKQQIWTRKPTHNMSGKSPRIPRNKTGYRQQGKVKFTIYDYINKF